MPLLASRIGTLAGGFAAIAATVAILLTGAATINGRDTSSTPDFVLETPDTVPDFDTEGGATPSPDELPFDHIAGNATPETDTAARRVAPDALSASPEVESKPLQRIEPRPQLSKSEPRVEKPAVSVLSQPIAVSAGEIRFGQGTIQLDGLASPSVERTCTGSDGKVWPCGMMARTALRNFIRGRALTCSVPDADFKGTITASCERGGKDVAQWLAENGWAEAVAGSPLKSKSDDAKAQKLGLFGNDPRGRTQAAPIDDVEFQ